MKFRASAVFAAGIAATIAMSANAQEQATAATTAVYEEANERFDWSDTRDFDAALRGLVARYPDPEIMGDTGNVVWRFRDDEGIRSMAAPSTVHPLLWRQQQLNAIHGLFEVTDGIYQLRGFDLANMTIIEGETGIIIVDPLTSTEVAQAALDLYYAHRPRRPVVAVIYTHSHMDHFGGAAGVVSREAVEAGEVEIIAPGNFLREAVSENVTAGNAMLRRTIYYSGIMAGQGEYGSVGAGLGPGVSNGTQSFIAPTTEIGEELVSRQVDGVEFVFMSANGTEAPSEFVFFLPDSGVLDVSEVAVRTTHNVLTPRGAKARDTALWWRTIDRMIEEFGPDMEILIGQHHWPAWGQSEAVGHLTAQRDLYKAIHDRALHLANSGATMDEIGDAADLPPGLASVWSVQDYYGTFGSGAEATYQFYLGWYDGNPARLDRLPQAESAVRYVDYMGGAEAILERAAEDYAAGEFRWVAEVLDRVIFAQPDNAAARELQARTLTQLGYQQVSATWRNVYLTAARELREGVVPIPPGARTRDYLAVMTAPMLLDYAGIALSPERSANSDLQMVVQFSDLGESYHVTVQQGLLNYARGEASDDTGPLVTLDRTAFDALLTGRIGVSDAVQAGSVAIEGNEADVAEFFDLFDSFTPDFNIVTP